LFKHYGINSHYAITIKICYKRYQYVIRQNLNKGFIKKFRDEKGKNLRIGFLKFMSSLLLSVNDPILQCASLYEIVPK